MSKSGGVKVATSHNMRHLPPPKLISGSINLDAVLKLKMGGRHGKWVWECGMLRKEAEVDVFGLGASLV
ncbi:MAG: hypothetical protein ACKERG_00195 [Candidatus Hodgkinia cicadicola]